MARWTVAQVAALAPDPSSLAAARRLTRPGPWSDTGSTDTLVWGKCQGSGRAPYQVSVDLTAPAFRCSCPSRKFPCKHGLALLLLWAEGGGAIADAASPADFAGEWAAERAARATTRTDRTASPQDAAAAAKRLEQRLTLMTAGMDDFTRWLTDLARTGLAPARQQPLAWWDATAARLVDAQMPGLAEDVRAVGAEVAVRPDWTDRLLAAVGRWWTASRAWAARETLDADELGDLRAYLGWATSSASVLEGERLTDRWLVLGAHRTDDGRLEQQRTWLRGEATGRTVQVLDFAAAGQPLPVARVVGSRLDAEVALHPGRGIRRAMLAMEPAVVAQPAIPPAGGTARDAVVAWAALRAENPWSRRAPVLLADARIGGDAAGFAVVDSDGAGFPVAEDVDPWPLLAVTGGRTDILFGELEDGRLRPLAVLADDRLVGV